jgi:hypothetical protein
MIWLRPHIETINRLVEADTVQSLTYAALECRLAIELVCYHRLKVARDYISHDDLKKWPPKDVVKKLIQDVDANIASTFTLPISTRPADQIDGEMTRADFEKFDYVPIGTQIGFDADKIGKMWNALSSFLHGGHRRTRTARRRHDGIQWFRRHCDFQMRLRHLYQATHWPAATRSDRELHKPPVHRTLGYGHRWRYGELSAPIVRGQLQPL